MSIVVMGMATDSDLDLKISRNLQLKNEAFNNAETGIDLAIESIRHSADSILDEGNGQDNTGVTNYDIYDYNLTIKEGLNLHDIYHIDENEVKVEVCNSNSNDPCPIIEITVKKYNKSKYINYFHVSSTGYSQEKTKSTINQVILTDSLDQAFRVGIASDGDITINGAPENIIGSLHANGSITQNGSGDPIMGNVTAVNGVDLGSDVGHGYIIDGESDEEKLPKITEKMLYSLKNEADLILNDGDDLEEKHMVDLPDSPIVFVDGSLNVDYNDINKVTLVATENITFSGGISWSDSYTYDEPLKTSVLAGGDITFNGSGEKHGIFWCNGSFTHNGSAKIYGSILASDEVENPDIDLHGKFDFEYFDNMENDFFPTPYITINRISWNQES